MSYYTPDVYNQPEQFDLEILKIMDDGQSYEFDITVLFKHSSGQLYVGADQGCSCPTPFEDYASLDSLHPVDTLLGLSAWLADNNVEHASRIEIIEAAMKAGLR